MDLYPDRNAKFIFSAGSFFQGRIFLFTAIANNFSKFIGNTINV